MSTREGRLTDSSEAESPNTAADGCKPRRGGGKSTQAPHYATRPCICAAYPRIMQRLCICSAPACRSPWYPASGGLSLSLYDTSLDLVMACVGPGREARQRSLQLGAMAELSRRGVGWTGPATTGPD